MNLQLSSSSNYLNLASELDSSFTSAQNINYENITFLGDFNRIQSEKPLRRFCKLWFVTHHLLYIILNQLESSYIPSLREINESEHLSLIHLLPGFKPTVLKIVFSCDVFLKHPQFFQNLANFTSFSIISLLKMNERGKDEIEWMEEEKKEIKVSSEMQKEMVEEERKELVEESGEEEEKKI